MATQEIQELRRDIPFIVNGDGPHATDGGMGFMVLNWIGSQGDFAPAYWSTARDKWLRDFYLRSDYLKIAVRTFTQKAYAIPLTVSARDRSVKAHNALAEQLHYSITRNSGLLRGFTNEFQKFIVDYLTQDNGAFMLVMGGGKADGPINGPVSGLLHLDAQRCTRTGHPEYPVVYYHIDGKRYALHYTRVILMSSTPSADAAHNDIGVCAVSACVDAAHDMRDIMTYTSEKLGSRPARQILYAKTGATLAQMRDATQLANVKMDAQSLERFSRTMLMAPAQQSGTPLELATIDLSSAPDGFDREKATVMDVAVIAAAFGMDARDLAHSFGLAGQTKADAEVQNLKTYGKGVTQFLNDFAEQLDQKVLPDSLESWFDYVDDTQDEQAATIRKTRAEGREIDLRTEVVTVRVAREQMLENQEISEEQFEDMELGEGRLADGLDVLMLFQSRDGELARLLDLGVDNPLDVAANNADAILVAIDEHILLAWERTTTAPNANIVRKAKQALAALNKLRGLYDAPADEALDEAAPTDESEEPADEAPADEAQPDAATKAIDAITPTGAKRALPDLPSEDRIAADAKRNVEAAMQTFDEVWPEYAGILDAAVSKKKELKQSDRFSYDERAFRYRDAKTGRFVSESFMRSLTEQYEAARRQVAPALAKQLANKEISVQQWVTSMRAEIRNTYTVEYLAGRGGRNAMTQADWGRLGDMLRNQYRYLDGFAVEIAAGNLSEAQIAARSGMYFNSATQAFERAKTVGARGMPSLPAYPGDGSSECRSNDKCHWQIMDRKDSWEATWTLSDAEHCSTCLERSGMWNPLVIPKQ